MIFKKFFYNSFLAIKNVNHYGFLLVFKSFFYEIYYSIKFKDFTFFNSGNDSDFVSNYNDTKIKNDYSTPDIPTPFYFLELIKYYIKEKRLKKFNIIDLGCGSGRLIKYFDYNFDINFIGIDVDKKIIKNNLKKFKKHNYKFYNIDLKKIYGIKDLNIIDQSLINNRKNIIFISDSIDSLSIINLIPVLKKKFKEFLFIMVNQKNISLFKEFNLIKSIKFKNESRNINFFQI